MSIAILNLIATLCAGAFFGAALYISLVQHPAALAAGGAVAGRFFPPMYRRAAPMQASLAVIGSVAALVVWLVGAPWPWLVGGLLLFAVVPLTLVWIKPTNDSLMQRGRDPESAETFELLRRWGHLHAVRTLLSGLALLLFLVELAIG